MALHCIQDSSSFNKSLLASFSNYALLIDDLIRIVNIIKRYCRRKSPFENEVATFILFLRKRHFLFLVVMVDLRVMMTSITDTT